MRLPAKLRNPDVLGWVIWIGLTLILIAPCTYIFWVITYDATTTTWTRFVAGIFIAAILAGVLSAIGNEVWFRVQRRRHNERRKVVRKEKRRKG